MDKPKRTPKNVRNRSYSVNTGRPWSNVSTTTLNRVQSDSDLNLIDRTKTFENSANMHDNGDLINRVVSALGSIRHSDDDEQGSMEVGINGFSDSQILSTERRASGWSLARTDVGSLRPVTFNRSISLNMPEDDQNGPNTGNKEVINRMLNRSNSPISRIISEQGKRNSLIYQDLGSQINLDRTKTGRASIISLPRQYISGTSKGRDSIVSILDAPINSSSSELLENTSIADLIRALEVVHSTSSQKEDEYISVPPTMKNHLSQDAGSRRGSLRPIPGYTTVFTSSDSMRPSRKISSMSNPESSLSRHLSLRPNYPPPQYTATVTPKPIQRYGVRPSNISPDRANTSTPPSMLLQKKLPLGPSPLARNDTLQDSIKRTGSKKRINELLRM